VAARFRRMMKGGDFVHINPADSIAKSIKPPKRVRTLVKSYVVFPVGDLKQAQELLRQTRPEETQGRERAAIRVDTTQASRKAEIFAPCPKMHRHENGRIVCGRPVSGIIIGGLNGQVMGELGQCLLVTGNRPDHCMVVVEQVSLGANKEAPVA